MTFDGLEETQEAPGEATRVTRVLVLWENGSANYFLHPGEQVKLGRHSECDIIIGLPSVSRRHARLSGGAAGTNEPATVEDLGGMNGVRVRGQLIAVQQPVPVGAGDVIELGGAVVLLHPPHATGTPSAGALARASAYRPSSKEDPMKATLRLIDVVAQSDLGVLVLGEPGAGKSFAAEAIHARSARGRGPLLRVDCAALARDPDALDRELFGHDGDPERRPGLLEAAAGGTVLLDQIGEMPLSTQTKLLDVLEKGTLPRGGVLDVRLVGTTNRDLLALSAEGTFLLALYYRLGGISIVIPPLRERTGEITRFALKFLIEAAARAGRPKPRLSNEALGVLVHHPFHGNLRELRDTMERACVLAKSGFIGPEHLVFEAGEAEGHAGSERGPSTLEETPTAAARVQRIPATQTELPDAPSEPSLPLEIPPPPRASSARPRKR